MTDPLISIVIPTHNRSELLPRAIESVRGQTFRDWEIMVIDDGSTDDTRSVVELMASRLGDRLVYCHQNRAGASAARNAGIDKARGRFIAFLDSDDEFQPAKLERQLRLFELRPELGLVYSDWTTVDIDGRQEKSVFDGRHTTARRVHSESVETGLHVCGDLFETLLHGYFICTIVGMVRKSVLGDRIRFCKDVLFGEEWLFYLEVAQSCRAGFVDEPLSIYHFHRGSLSRSDKHRNTFEYKRLLEAIRSAFPDLNTSQRRIINRQIAQLDRQIACVAYREARFDTAAAHFASALRNEPNIRTFWHLGQSLWRNRGGRHLPNRADNSSHQERLPFVR